MPYFHGSRLAASVSHLLWLNRSQRNIYTGTVPDDVIAKRRAKNKVARRSRRINRT